MSWCFVWGLLEDRVYSQLSRFPKPSLPSCPEWAALMPQTSVHPVQAHSHSMMALEHPGCESYLPMWYLTSHHCHSVPEVIHWLSEKGCCGSEV